MQDEYRTVARPGVHETEVNRSRFLCALAPAATEQEAQDVIARIRKEHTDASHNCFAYVIGADHKVSVSPITVALVQDATAVISSGLRPGETVVTDGQMSLKPGSTVIVRNSNAQSADEATPAKPGPATS